MPDTCPRCGARSPFAAPCPQCSTDPKPVTSATFVDSIATRVPGSVLDSLERSFGPMPQVLLPDSFGTEDASPVVQLSSTEMPEPVERTSKLQLLGEIARGGMGAVLKGRDPTWAATSPSKCCSNPTATTPTSPAASSRSADRRPAPASGSGPGL